MALTETQQISETFKRANDVLVTFCHDPHHDGATSAIALTTVLRKMGKRVEVAADEWTPPAELKFIRNITEIKPTLEHIQKFLIEVDVSETSAKNLTYDVRDGKLVIALVPKSGTWRPEHVIARPDQYRFDLVCAIGTPDLASLGGLFHKHADFFYHTPIVNIDHDPANEHYGQINHIDINAVACGEVLYHLLKRLDRHMIDDEVATCLLTGMIAKTRSFKTKNVTPQTLAVASELVAMGARREDIVHHLYRTRTVPVLRLWGRALARLKHDSEHKLVWTLLSKQDFMHAGATPHVLTGVIDELIVNAPDARIAVILHEHPESMDGKGVVGMLHAERPISAAALGRPFGAIGNRETVTFELKDKTLIDAEPYVIQEIKDRLAGMKLV